MDREAVSHKLREMNISKGKVNDSVRPRIVRYNGEDGARELMMTLERGSNRMVRWTHGFQLSRRDFRKEAHFLLRLGGR